MGAKWEAVLVRGSRDAITDLPGRLLPLADHSVPRIRFTLVVTRHRSAEDVWCLECLGVNKNPLQVSGSLPDVLRWHDALAAPEPLAKQAAFSATVAMGLAVASAVARATYLFFSDGLSRSGGFHLSPEPVESLWSEPSTPGGYGTGAVTLAQPYVPGAQFIEDVMEAFEDESRLRWAWRLLDRRELLRTPELLGSEHP